MMFTASGTAEGLTLKPRRAVDAMAFAGAAYLMMGQAYVALGKNEVWLSSKKLSTRSDRSEMADNLAARFQELYDEQKDFWKQARAQKAERASILQEALALATPGSSSIEDAFGELSPERKAEIAALLAEPPIEDKFGIARTWMETRKK